MNEQTSPSLKDSMRQTKETISSKASEVAAQAKERGQEYLHEGKDRTAERIESYGESMHQAADRFEREHDPNIAHYTAMMANKLEHAASYLRQRDFRDLRRDAEELARRHPAVFFGGMFVAGLAAARFFKASCETSTRALYDETEPRLEEAQPPAGLPGTATHATAPVVAQ
jgi:gas vesicle protein